MGLLKYILTVCILYSSVLFGQSEVLNRDYSADQSDSRDRLVIEFTNDGWSNAPEGIAFRSYSIGINAYIIHDLFREIDKPFSFGVGYGISSHNVHSDGIFNVIDSAGSTFAFIDKVDNSNNLRKNKYTINYLEFPIEFRYITNNGSGFKWHLGGKIGYKLGDYSKIVDGFGKRKFYKTSGIHDFRYGLHTRIGYGRFTAVGYYSLTPLFKKNRGPDLNQFSLGIAFILL